MKTRRTPDYMLAYVLAYVLAAIVLVGVVMLIVGFSATPRQPNEPQRVTVVDVADEPVVEVADCPAPEDITTGAMVEKIYSLGGLSSSGIYVLTHRAENTDCYVVVKESQIRMVCFRDDKIWIGP